MYKYLLPFILVSTAFAIFFFFTRPLYDCPGCESGKEGIVQLRSLVGSYNEALTNSKALENERDKLTEKSNRISPENSDKLLKLLPENVDNIRLILEIEKIAAPYGMILKDVRYNATATKKEETSTNTNTSNVQTVEPSLPKDYGAWDLEFSTSGTYERFLSFLQDLENNLRIVDISSIDFSSGGVTVGKEAGASLSASSAVYRYGFKIKTYWLKN